MTLRISVNVSWTERRLGSKLDSGKKETFDVWQGQRISGEKGKESKPALITEREWWLPH
jgi:hypothetical protein